MTTPSSQATSQDDVTRTFTLEGSAETMERQLKKAEIRGFEIMCDEREPIGDNSAPSPLAYFATSILF